MKYLSLLSMFLLSVVFLLPLDASALTVSPAKIEITGDPGTTVSAEIILYNEQNEEKKLFTSAENFEPSGDTGAPKFIGSDTGLATWIKLGSAVTIAQGEKKTIPFTITIPKDATPGGYFGAVFFGNQPPVSKDGGEVSVGGKIGVLVLLRVSGQVTESAGFSEFKVHNGKRFFSSLPLEFSYKINNDGGDRIVPLGEVKIKNTFALTSATVSANKTEGSVLPGSVRKFVFLWGEKPTTEVKGFLANLKLQWSDFHFGWYTAHMNIAWGAGTDQRIKDSVHFFIIPWQLLIVVLPILCVLFLFFRFALRKYNSWIISKVQPINKD